jgi:hypothetical protein
MQKHDRMLTGTKPEEPVELSLWEFAFAANWNTLHPLDSDRFYGFIVKAYGHDSKWDREDVRTRLLGYGLPAELAASLARDYEVARCVLLKMDRLNDRDLTTVGASDWK